MEKQIEKLMKKYRYCTIQHNVLYWRSGNKSGRIAISHIDSITFEADKAVLKSAKGTEFGYHEVIFTAEGVVFTEVLDDVVYYNFKR